MSTFRLRIEFEDRTKMVLDTSKAIAKYDLNITALEVLPNLMYFELQHNNGDDQVNEIDPGPGLHPQYPQSGRSKIQSPFDR